jgi:lipopolysaccharide biosynthesis protein
MLFDNIYIMKTLILYAACDGDKYYLRIKKFLRDGVFENPDIKFMIIFNGSCPQEISKLIPSYVLFMERPNLGFDFGAWSHGILNINYNEYDSFIFVNCSVYGPCLPTYIDKSMWPSFFTSKLNDKIKLVGCTTNTAHRGVNIKIRELGYNETYLSDCHVQSYCWCVDKVFLLALIGENYFSVRNTNPDKWFYIFHYEIQNVYLLRKHGYDYFSFEYFHGKPAVVYENISVNNNFIMYFSTQINPFEFIFIKPEWNSDNNYFQYLLKFDNIQ